MGGLEGMEGETSWLVDGSMQVHMQYLSFLELCCPPHCCVISPTECTFADTPRETEVSHYGVHVQKERKMEAMQVDIEKLVSFHFLFAMRLFLVASMS